jgi:LmbE family N-acetylglucosaminyl deacetylase
MHPTQLSGHVDSADVGGIRQAGTMAENTLTLMAVHAHPDDEASSTGGVLAKYSAEGVRTVVVTCTNGEFGDAPGQVKPGTDGHDEQVVAQLRLSELRESCKILGVTNLELLGYHDSGMPDWDYRNRPDAFCNVPQELVAARIVSLIEQYRPQIVISYDPDGAYQHPDHVHAARSALAAVTSSGLPAKFYQTAFRRGDWRKVMEALRDAGEDVGEWEEPTPEVLRQMEEEERRITTTIDIHDELGVKRDALMAHASQIEDSWFSKIPPEVAAQAFGRESFVRVIDSTHAPVPESDLFSGLR